MISADEKSAINRRFQELYDAGMQAGKHGHYETMFIAMHEAYREYYPGWQLIETAPHDGTFVLVWRPDEGDCSHPAHADMDVWRLDTHDKGVWWFSRRNQQPTHWMPRPKPPVCK